MRKRVAFLFACVMMAVSAIGNPIIAKAGETDGWLPYAQEVDLDTTYVGYFDGSDYYYEGSSYDYYVDVYKISMTQKGELSIYLESKNENYLDTVEGRLYYEIYDGDNPDKIIFQQKNGLNGVGGAKYSSARNIYYGNWNVALDKGDYYFVIWASIRRVVVDGESYSVSFNYKPSITTPFISSVSGKKGALKTLWNKVSDVDGYQIAVSSSSDFSDSNTKVYKVAGNSKTKKKIKNLYRGTNYYVRIRSYKSANITGETKTYYSDWSDSVSTWTK